MTRPISDLSLIHIYFAGPYFHPFAQRLTGGPSSGTDIPGDSAHETQIAHRNPVIIIDVERRQRTDIDAVFFFLGNILGQLVVERMNSLDDDRLIFLRPGCLLYTSRCV